MDLPALRFLPGLGVPAALPLARYLPPLPPGMATQWLAENVPPGSWLLDPLGASPPLIFEAARAGYRVLVACNNPILSFLIETLAAAPRFDDFQAVLAELAASRRGEERLEQHIQALYQTTCDTCAEVVQAQAFLWRKGEAQPYARLYQCPKCGESGERPVTPQDLERLARMGGDKMQRVRALQRVIMNEDEYRADVEEALESYLPRPLYALFTLLNKIEGLDLPPERLRLLHALMLSVFDAGNTLWSWPSGRTRPRQLTVPSQFRENNLWMALEEAAKLWSGSEGRPPNPIPLVHWPNQPPEQGGICLFHGRVKALTPLPEPIQPQAVIAAFPRPSQAFWTLSVLWSGWLWGKETTLPLRNILDRRRYDWNWHTTAVHSALAAVSWTLPPETPFFGLIPELAPGFLGAVVTAAEAGGFRLDGIALREGYELAQLVWRPVKLDPAKSEAQGLIGSRVEAAARQAMRADLLSRGEPAPYLTLYAAGLWGLARDGLIPRSLSSIPGDLLTQVQAGLGRNFPNRSFLRFFGTRPPSGSPDEERGWWWLAQAEAPAAAEMPLPLVDRVEMETVRILQKRAAVSWMELDQALCSQFTGLMTPAQELVQSILASYAEEAAVQPGIWRMRSGEQASARRADLEESRQSLETIGRHLGYRIENHGNTLTWVDPNGGPDWWFFGMASSIISRFVFNPPAAPPEHCTIVLPGGRAHLLTTKLRRDPRLAEAARGWRFLKFRHLRDIARREGLTRDLWDALLDEDPLTDEATQMPLFSP